MSSSSLSAAAGRYVTAAAELASRLDFASRVAAPRQRLADHRITLERLWWDLYATAAPSGVLGADLFEVGTTIREQLVPAVDAHDQDGNLDPWGRCRDRVLELLAAMRASCPTSAAVETPASREIMPTPAAAGVGNAALPQTGGDKGGTRAKPRRLSRSRLPGRPTKDASGWMRRLESDMSSEIRDEGLTPDRVLPERLYSQTAESICEMVLSRYRQKIGLSTLRSCDVWKAWKRYRGRKLPADSNRISDIVDAGELNVGGCKRTADERRLDAVRQKWESSMGICLDDDNLHDI